MCPVEIAELDLETNDSDAWKLLGRVAHKSGPIPTAQHYQFNFVLEDSSAHIRIFVSDEFFDQFFSIFEHGQVIEVAHLSRAPGTLRNSFAPSQPSDMIARVHALTDIVVSDSVFLGVPLRERPLPMPITLSEFDECATTAFVDLDAVIVSVSGIMQGPKATYRRVQVVDHTITADNAVTLALWREHALHFKGTVGDVLRIRSATVTAYFRTARHLGSLSHDPITSITVIPKGDARGDFAVWLNQVDTQALARLTGVADTFVSASIGNITVEAVRARLPPNPSPNALVRYSTSGSFASISPVSQHVFKGCTKCWKKSCGHNLGLRDVLFVQAAIRAAPHYFALSIPCTALATYFSLSSDNLLALYRDDLAHYTALINSLKLEPRFDFRISAQIDLFRETESLKSTIISFTKA